MNFLLKMLFFETRRFHDNLADANWILSNMDDLANRTVQGITAYLTNK